MSRDRIKVSYEPLYGEVSAAYLAMWAALSRFNAAAHRWSEPAEFGDSARRIQVAEEAVQRAKRTVEHCDDPKAKAKGVKLNAELDAVYRRFQEALGELQAGSEFSPTMNELMDELGKRGARLADQSVTASLAGQAGN